jgi:porin
LLPSRDLDRWGVAYFRDNIGNDLTNGLDALGVNLDREEGWELLYNIAVTPCLRVTIDAQFIKPVLVNSATTSCSSASGTSQRPTDRHARAM